MYAGIVWAKIAFVVQIKKRAAPVAAQTSLQGRFSEKNALFSPF
jgi:hypothetical protein